MGNSKSKKSAKEPDKFFEREKWREQMREEKRKKKANPKNKRIATMEPALPPAVLATPPPAPGPAAPPPQARSFDDEALNLMRYQLRNDADAFLLNNILLSVQFFENYEREMQHIRNNPISEHEHLINEAMVRHNKHVFFADRLQETVNEHVVLQKIRGQTEPLTSPRQFVIYDNVEASEPGDTSDYSAVLDAPFYKLRIEDCKEPGFVKLKKLEVLESTLSKDNDLVQNNTMDSGDSIYTDSEKESYYSDGPPYSTKGEALLEEIKSRINTSTNDSLEIKHINDAGVVEDSGRRRSGPIKQVSLQVEKNKISNMNKLRKRNDFFLEEVEEKNGYETNNKTVPENFDSKPRKSILKIARRLSGPMPDTKLNQNFEIKPSITDSVIYEDTETSGYRSNSSSRQTEVSESESDYGYSTITQATTPKRVELSSQSNDSHSSGVLPDETWITIETRAVDWSDEEDDLNDSASKESLSRNLYESHQFLCSTEFMGNFVDNFIINLGSVLGLSQDAVKGALTQGASVYCDTVRNGNKIANEVFPALIASWPNTANQWIIRERKIIQNPRTNFSYQWPTKYMVSKAIGFGCLLVPIGFRPKRGLNVDQQLQWKIIFPAAERYLESCLAHAHMRCYLFALALQKSFMECESSRIGLDANHLKNHLFWQCEDNYARWPEHRLGESLRMFLRSFYLHLGQGRFPNYFIENCNDFKSIPKPLLLKQQRQLADILEAPVMHILSSIDKLRYTKKDFYPTLNVHRLYDILTSKNPLRILNPNLPTTVSNYVDSTESEDDQADTNFWDKSKRHDKHYQWKKEKQRQLQERRKAQFYTRRQRASTAKPERELKTNVILPLRMEVERRRLVIEFFIPHFIAMARSSEKFEAIRQAVIYLEQAQRLSILLKEEPGGDNSANEYLDVIRDKLVDCQRKLVTQGGYKLPPRRESLAERSVHRPNRKSRPQYDNFDNHDSPGEAVGFSPFTFVEVHAENSSTHNAIKLGEMDEEESKL